MRLSAGLLMLAACSGPTETPKNQGPEPLRIAGSESITNSLLPMLAHGFERTSNRVRFDIEGGGSHVGFRSLLDGDIDIAASSRRHTPAEEEQAKVNGFSFEDDTVNRHIVAVDVVGISVHPDNPIDSLTYDQVIGIFCTQDIDSWAFLGLEDRPITPFVRPPGSGTRALFEDFFCGPRGLSPHIPLVSVEEANGILKTDVNAISFVSMTESSGKILGLRAHAQGKPVMPSHQNILRGAYPLYHDLYLYTRDNPGVEVDHFVKWISSPAGQDVIDEARFVPLFLRPERMDEPRPLRETVHFEPGSSIPDHHSSARIKLLVDELRARAGLTKHVVLEGYTDNQEPDRTALSEARAQAVRDLLSQELPGIYWEIIPRGADHAIAPNTTPYGRMRNRRVQIYLAEESKQGDIIATPR